MTGILYTEAGHHEPSRKFNWGGDERRELEKLENNANIGPTAIVMDVW